jgi:hypothetical protein
VPEGESRVPLQSEPSPPARSRDPWGGFFRESPAERLSRERSGGKGRTQILPGSSPTARILPDAGLLVVWRQGQHGLSR